ncbi:hypothetical protein AUS31_27330, partial [Escherichia coli]
YIGTLTESMFILFYYLFFFFHSEDGIRFFLLSRGLGDEKKRPALLFNNLSDNLCGHSKIRILNVARRKMNTKSQE